MGDDGLGEGLDFAVGAAGLIVPFDHRLEIGLEGVLELEVLVKLADVDVDEAYLLDQVAEARGVEAGDVAGMDADGGAAAEAAGSVGRAHP